MKPGAEFAGHPQGLASALRKLGAYSKQIPMQQAEPNTAHMFIVNPLSGRSFATLFSTHPPLEERIERLVGQQTQPFGPGDGGPVMGGSDDDRGRREAQDAWRHLQK